MRFYSAPKDFVANENTVVDTLSISSILEEFGIENTSKYQISDAWINIGGWQSWNPGFEIEPNSLQPSLTCKLIKQWNNYLVFPETKYSPNENLVLGQFVSYLRWDDFYLVFASYGNVEEVLPPVQFIFDKKYNCVKFELADKGKKWFQDEKMADIRIYIANSFFDCKQKLKEVFGNTRRATPFYSNRFDSFRFLGKIPLGWESWYNHYSDIDEKLILEDLQAVAASDSFINKVSSRMTAEHPIFQIDDGWEKQLGNWEADPAKFPSGMAEVANKISEKGFLPGIWIAPFIIDFRSPIAKEHPDWLLKDSDNKLIAAGYNPLWGAKFGKMQPSLPGSFFCLDLSNKDVLDYLDSIMEKIVNEWGYRYIKLDFLYAGMLYGKYSKSGAAYQWYTKAISLLTKRNLNNKEEKVAYLGCGVPFELSFNDLPLSRIGCDTYENWDNHIAKKLDWNGRNSAYLNLKDTIGRTMWNKIIYTNDPDVLFIRNKNCSLSHDEKILIATVNIILGNQIMYSDDPTTLNSPEEKALVEEIHEIIKKYDNEEFGVKPIGPDLYELKTKSGKYSGQINLGKKHFIVIEEN